MPEQRYEYDFVRVKLRSKTFSLTKVAERDYRQIIAERAAEGWRFVQVFAPGLSLYGDPWHFELIFERPVGGQS
ncbi:MAG: DUF4177 domain-containing protein [Planctomycetota bacterium]